jgi:hypothetical protein
MAGIQQETCHGVFSPVAQAVDLFEMQAASLLALGESACVGNPPSRNWRRFCYSAAVRSVRGRSPG